jgi:rod shape-determining protein MreC
LNSKIPVILEPFGIQAVVSGTGKYHGSIEYTKKEYENEISDTEIIVYTSGLGGLFKSGVPVGKIFNNKVDEIIFFSDFKQLNYVKIVTYNIEGNN